MIASRDAMRGASTPEATPARCGRTFAWWRCGSVCRYRATRASQRPNLAAGSVAHEPISTSSNSHRHSNALIVTYAALEAVRSLFRSSHHAFSDGVAPRGNSRGGAAAQGRHVRERAASRSSTSIAGDSADDGRLQRTCCSLQLVGASAFFEQISIFL